MMFRELSPAEVAEFKQWARDFYIIGDTIKTEVWHPVIVAECEAINAEAALLRRAIAAAG